MRCPKGGDVRMFLTSLRYKCEELAAARVCITNKEYQCTVLRGIPEDMAKFASSLLSSACLIHHSSTIDTDTLIDHICEESECLKNCCTCNQQGSGSGKKDSQDEALAVTNSEGVKKKRCKGKCHNCDKPGHWVHECRMPKKEGRSTTQTSGQATQVSLGTARPETRPVGSANAVDADDSDADGFWVVKEVTPVLEDSTELDNLSDWTEDSDSEWTYAVITPVEESVACVELYDSGATRHISPYKDDFVTYSLLPAPVLLNTANKQCFPAIGTGTLRIYIPNEDLVSKLILDNVLHAPAVSYTLVSLGMLDDLGYHTALGGGCLDLHSPDGTWIG
jgi:hypothetical protein